MGIIHMETDQVRDLVRRLQNSTLEFSERRDAMRSAAAGLASAWQGGPSGEYQQELQQLLASLSRQAELLDRLGQRVTREVDEWEEADRTFGLQDGESFSLKGAWNKAKGIGGATLQGAKNSAKWIGSKAKSGAIWVTSKVKGGGEKKIPLLDLTPVTKAAFQKTWDGMNQTQKIDYLQKLHNTIAVNYNFPATTIKCQDLVDSKGQDAMGVRRANEIVIDVDNLKSDDPWVIQEIIAHESRHEMQHYLVDHPKERPSSISNTMLNGFRENFNDYHRPTDDFKAYWNQPVESDARTFGDSFVDSLYK